MRENRLRTLWAEDKPAVNGWLSIPHTFTVETMAHQAWDSLTVDLQHGLADYSSALSMFTAIATTDTTPMARIPWFEPGIIGRLLDAGAYGIICPMINSPEECAAFVAATRYAPLGARSYGPIRAGLYAGADYWQHANQTVIAMAMIETRQAVESLDAILATPGLDAIYVGPSDLSLSYGVPPAFDHEFGPVADAVDHIVARARARGIVPGIHTASPDFAVKMVKKGFRFVTVGTDARLFATAANEAVTRTKKGIAA